MYNSQFDGNAAFSGGGFMPSQATQAPETSYSATKNREIQALLPLTVKQINDAFLSSDDKSNFVIDGVDVNNVKLVGMVGNRAGRITDLTFILDDGTGRIDCNKWVNEAVDTNEVEGIRDGMYVRIHGHLKSFQGKRTLNVFSISILDPGARHNVGILDIGQSAGFSSLAFSLDCPDIANITLNNGHGPVTDFNEITNHFIECMYVHLYNTRQKQKNGMPNQPQMTSSASNPPIMGHHPAMSNQFLGQYNVGGQKSIEQMILEFLQLPSCDTDRGAHRDVIARQLNVPVDKLMLGMKNLEEEGLVYSTTDDFHFKSTANG